MALDARRAPGWEAEGFPDGDIFWQELQSRKPELVVRDVMLPGIDGTELLRRMREIPGIKKVFVRSGIRYDYMLQDKDRSFFKELVQYHISGQLKVAPEHCVSSVLDYMGKPHFDVFLKFWRQYQKLNEERGTEQYLVPYLMSSHPGCTLSDAVELAEFLHKNGRTPEQVQDFYPTPGTLSTCMYYTGIDPRDMSEVYVARGSIPV